MRVVKGVITQPGSTGQQTYTPQHGGGDAFSASIPLRAVILWTVARASAAVGAANYLFSYGFGTDDGGTAQRYYNTAWGENGAATQQAAGGHNTTAILKLLSDASATVDLEVDFDEITSDTSFVLDWVNLHSTASIEVHYLAIGGSDVAKARVGSFVLGTAATQDVTINTGFGNADLLIFGSRSRAVGDTGTDSGLMLGADNGTQRACHCFSYDDGSNAVVLRDAQKQKAIVSILENVIDAEADWDPANDPTDGFRLSVTDTPASGTSTPVGYLALQGTFSSTIGVANAPTSTGNQSLTHSEEPVGAMLWGRSFASGSTIDTGNADNGGFRLYGSDGTNEGGAFAGSDDASDPATNATAHSTSKSLQKHFVATLRSEADGSVSGNDFVLNWNDADATQDEFIYLLLGGDEGGGGGETVVRSRLPVLGVG